MIKPKNTRKRDNNCLQDVPKTKPALSSWFISWHCIWIFDETTRSEEEVCQRWDRPWPMLSPSQMTMGNLAEIHNTYSGMSSSALHNDPWLSAQNSYIFNYGREGLNTSKWDGPHNLTDHNLWELLYRAS